jgi:alcohol dehydrogenase (cytochrome c)/quinohemoprotein ethanol dehydrogenase
MLLAAPKGEWLNYGRDYAEQRFSPLALITDKNVGQLGLAWSADLDTARGQEATPLMHDGILYVSTAWSMVKAYDARTGALKWSYDPQVPRETLARACCDAVNRGVALYGDKLYVGTLDGRLIALEQSTGHVAWSKTVVPNQIDYTITGAPRVAEGKVFIGSGGAEFRARGYLAAYDAMTGRELWKFHTVPGNPAAGFENQAMAAAAGTWAGKWWELGGGGTVWDTIVYDPTTKLVLFGTGNAEPWNPSAAGRDGDSLYTSSIVAVHADTGAYAWHFQETPEDRWDFDSDAPVMLADITIDGKQRHVALHAPKNGYFYVLDARTGQFLSTGSIVPQNWTTGIDTRTGRPQINPEARYEKTGATFVAEPNGIGAHSWQPMSFSPKTGLVYIPVANFPFPYTAAKEWKASGVGWQYGLDGAAVSIPADKQAKAAMLWAISGALVAWDPVAQKPAWRATYDTPVNGGTLVTAGNLVFQGTGTGDLVAYSADRGERLWSFPVQSGVIAAPMSFAVGSEQYIAILAGWGGATDMASELIARKGGITRNISRLLVFRLGATGKLPALAARTSPALDPPPFTGTAQQVARGASLYGRYCFTCHGAAAVSLGINPDLRHSGTLNSSEAIGAIVVDGALKHDGMVSFRTAIDRAGAEAIRQYLIKRANDDKTDGQAD